MSYVRLGRNVIEVNPLAVLSLDYTLCAKDHTVRIILGKGVENSLNSVNGKLLRGFLTKARKHLVSVVVMVIVVVAAAGAMLVVVVMMMLVIVAVALLTVMMVLVIVAMALIVVMVMLVIVAMAFLVVMVMLVIVAMALIVVMMVLVIVAMAFLVVMMLVIVTVAFLVVMMMVMLMLVLKLLNSSLESILLLHSCENDGTVKLVPRCSNDGGIWVVLSDKLERGMDFIFLCNIGMRKNYARCIGNLVVVELTKVLHIHLTLVDVGNGSKAVELCALGVRGANSLDNVRKLTDTAGLYNNAVGVEFVKYLNERLGKIADQGAADTARVHLGNLNTRVLKETAVDAYLAKLILDKHELFTLVRFLDKLFYKRCFACSEEAGKNIYFRHFKKLLPEWAYLQNSLLCILYIFDLKMSSKTPHFQVKKYIFPFK